MSAHCGHNHHGSHGAPIEIIMTSISTHITKGLGVLCFLSGILCTSSLFAQFSIGAGYIPVHASGQSDFTADQSPIDVFAIYQRGSLGLRLDYNQTSSYIKDRFSFKQTGIELSLQYSLQKTFGLYNFDPYVRAGVSSWGSDFTTEGYPGIQDYELKVESDSGLGAIAAIGMQYYFTSNVAFGFEAQYAKNGNAQFIAGGFDPQPLSLDQIRFMIVGKYTLFGSNESARGSSGKDVDCPKF